MSVAPVCRVGDRLQLMCTASASPIRWRILQVNELGALTEVTNSVIIDSRDDNQEKQREVNSATFTFTRSSNEDTLPLISTLSIDSVSIGLNGTVVNCTDVSNPMILASTTIQIVNVSQFSKLTLMIYYDGIASSIIIIHNLITQSSSILQH